MTPQGTAVLPLLDEEPTLLPSDAPKWRRRLHALWWGYSLEPEQPKPRSRDEAEIEDEEDDEPEDPDALWSPRRIQAVQTLFGEGMIGPGGDTALAALVRPCTLNNAKSATELGAALGGLCRWAHADAGTYFKAFEGDAVLAAAGMDISTRKGLTNKCPVDHAPIEKFDVRAKSQDAIIAKEVFYRVADKVALFTRILEALKPSGIMSFSDYMSTTPNDPLIQAAFPGAHMLPPEQERAAAGKAGFDVRVFEDRTAEHIKATLEAFEAFAAQIKTAPPPERLRKAVLKEGELWSVRLNLLQNGKVTLYRTLAVKPL